MRDVKSINCPVPDPTGNTIINLSYIIQTPMKMQFLWMVAVCLTWSVISEAATLQRDSNSDEAVIGIVPDADVARVEDNTFGSPSDPRDGDERHVIVQPQLLQSLAEEDTENGVSSDDSDVSVEEHFPVSVLDHDNDDDNDEFELICKYHRRRRSRGPCSYMYMHECSYSNLNYHAYSSNLPW